MQQRARQGQVPFAERVKVEGNHFCPYPLDQQTPEATLLLLCQQMEEISGALQIAVPLDSATSAM